MKTKYFLLILLVGLMFSFCLGGYAGFLYQAKDIEFTPNNSEWKVTNIQDAMTNLYDDLKIPLISKINWLTDHSYSQGTRSTTRYTSLTLDSGSYIVFSVSIDGTSNSGGARSSLSYINSGRLIVESDDVCTFIKGTNQTQDNSTGSAGHSAYIEIHKCVINSDNSIISYKTHQTFNTTDYSQSIQLFSVKIE